MIAVSMTLLVMKAAIVESPGMIDGMMNFHVSQPDVTIMINAISALYLLTMSMIRLVILTPLWVVGFSLMYSYNYTSIKIATRKEP